LQRQSFSHFTCPKVAGLASDLHYYKAEGWNFSQVEKGMLLTTFAGVVWYLVMVVSVFWLGRRIPTTDPF
jgi:hypothetical protein